MHIEHLVQMANEIAAFFDGASDEGEAAKNVAAHLRRYWDPRMRKQIAEHVQAGGPGLTSLARASVELLAQSAASSTR